jgi:NAD-dependent SIR2 family protein deacetylase
MGLTSKDQDALISLAFSVHSNPRAYAVLLGAGVSIPSGTPGAWEVVRGLITKAARASIGGTEPEDPEAWYETNRGKKPTYQGVLEEFAPTPEERQRLLRPHFDPQENGGRRPTAAHRAIAKLVKTRNIRVILTLNFDRLMEDALSEEGVHPTVIETPSKLGVSLSPLHTLDCVVVHLHGDYLSPLAMLNTNSELESYDTQLQKFLREILTNYGLIIAGWSAAYDPALKSLIERHYPGRYTPTWIEPFDLSSQATDLIGQLKATRIESNADEALGFLEDAVVSMATKRSQHPLAVSVAVAAAKRELSKEPVSIQLHDTLHSELSLIATLPETTLPEDPGEAMAGLAAMGGAHNMAQRTAEAARSATALAACLGYWGEGDQYEKLLLDAVSRLSTPLSAHPLTETAGMSRVAGQSLFYGAGVAAVAAERWDLLIRLLRLETPGKGKRENLERAVDVLAAPGPMSRLNLNPYRTVNPLLNEALTIGSEPVERAWERFELLRLAHKILSNPNFHKLAEVVREYDEPLAAATKARDEAQALGKETYFERAALTQARRDSAAQLGSLLGQVRADHLHIEVVEDFKEDILYSPEVRRMQVDAWALDALVRAEFATSEADLVMALRAVDIAASAAASAVIQRFRGRHFFTDPRWLDERSYPEDLAASPV